MNVGAVPTSLVDFTPTLLVVDDEAYICTALRRIFERADIKVHTAYGAEEGLERLSQLDVQVVVSDFMMPGHDGAWFLSQVRVRWPKIQRILLTAGGRAQVDDLQRAINEGGVQRFLTKPWSNEALIATVRECFDHWRMLAERDRLLELLEETNRGLEAKVQTRTQDLQRASHAWRRTFDAISDPLTLVDDQLRIGRANLAAANAAGTEIRSLMGRRCHEALFGRDAPCPGCPVVASGHRPEPGAAVELDEDATGRVWRVTAWPSSEPESEAGGSAFSVCQYEDITKQRALQRQVILLEKVAAIGELAGCVAHELNNPLTGILTFSQILARGTGMGADETQSLASEIESSAERCKFIVQALLDFARPGATLEYSPVDLAEVVDSCVRLVTVSQKSFRDMKLELDFEQRLPEVLGNSDALKSVFLNLVSNAVQAMSPGGVLRIRAGVEPDGRRVRIVVEDNGPGIPAHLRERVFEPFFTTKATNKSGTGLGLTIVRNVVRDHGGQLELGGSPEGGACFTIHLPVAHPATGVPDRRAP